MTQKPILKYLPLKIKNNINMDNMFDFSTFKVAVQYCVLRSKTKNNT